MKKIVATVLMLWCSWCSAVTLDDLQQRFSRMKVVRAAFEQTRQISGMAQPLRSSGQMLVSRDLGLWWHQQQPFAMTLVLNDQRMVQVVQNQPAQVITAQKNPQMFEFNHLMRALFQADKKVLEENFTIECRDLTLNSWQVVLTPKRSPLAKLFSLITLSGDDYLQAVEIHDRQGDVTRIVFSQQRTEPTVLSEQEQQYFAD